MLSFSSNHGADDSRLHHEGLRGACFRSRMDFIPFGNYSVHRAV